jgi:hypothetical protein
MRAYRREGPRIDVEALAWEVLDGRETSSLAVELSPSGVRLERPYIGGQTRREVPLQIEVPGVDEVIWAKGEACFDRLVPTRDPIGGPLGLVRRTGYRIVAAARRDLKLLEELVVETYKKRQLAMIDLAIASCYAPRA